MRKFYCIIFFSLFLVSCSPKLQKNGRYETPLEAEVTHTVSRDLNSYNLIFVPLGMAEMSKDFGYFNSVMTHTQVDKLLELEATEPINPQVLSGALRERGLDHKFLVLEEVEEESLRTVYQWNLLDTEKDELLFSSRIQVNQRGTNDAVGALGNSLLDYLEENAQKVSGKIKEERIFPYFKVGYNSLFSLVNSSSNQKAKFGIGLGLYGEYRFVRPLALEIGLNSIVAAPFRNCNKSTLMVGAPLRLKWYPINSFDFHLGPQVNYIDNPKVFNEYGIGLIDKNKVTWDMTFGIGFNWADFIAMSFDYSRGITEIGKDGVQWQGSTAGKPIKLDTFTFGFGLKF